MAFTIRRAEGAGWWVLGVLLALTIGRAATAPRDRWPGLVGDEPTYLMQAESLAWDGDVRFAREDLERFRERRGHSPEVILQSGDRGERIVYGKPFLYAIAIAPFVRVLGERGALLANALALAAAALLAARALVREGSVRGPVWIAVVVFGSVAFGHVYWIHPDLFLLSCSAAGLAVAHLLRAPAPVATGSVARALAWARLPRPHPGPPGERLAWALTGALLAVPGVWRPPYLLLLVPGFYLAAGGSLRARSGEPLDHRPGRGGWEVERITSRSRSVVAFAAGALAIAVIAVAGQERISGHWTPYGGERRGFSELEGFPGVDFPASEWSARVEGKGNTSWLEDGAVEVSRSPLLSAWNVAYVCVGRTVGLLPYFLPALVGLAGRRAGRAARIEAIVGIVVAFAFVVLRPFNFYGGEGALANRYFLPLFPLFWFANVGLVRCVATTLVAAPFVFPLWLSPAAYPIVPGEGYRYVSSVARRLLPVETTQRHVKAPGRPDVLIGELWVRFLDGGLTVPGEEASPGTLLLTPGRTAEILIGNARPLAGVAVEALDGATLLTAEGPGAVAPSVPAPRITVRFERPTARHAMWWTDEPFHLYRVTLETAGTADAVAIPVRLTAATDSPPPR